MVPSKFFKMTKLDADKLGSTAAGRAWCQKALNPAEDAGIVRGIPDASNAPTVQMNYTKTVIVSLPTEGTWEGELYFLSDPVVPMSWYLRETAGTNPGNGVYVNSSLGVELDAALNAWCEMAEAWRPTHYGATIYLDAPAVADQGSVAAAQYIAKPRSLGHPAGVGAAEYDVQPYVMYPEAVMWQENDTCEYADVLMMPMSYTGLAKAGVYLPLKLDEGIEHYHDHRDLCLQCDRWTAQQGEPPAGILGYRPGTAELLTGGLYPGLTGAYAPANTCAWQGDVTLRPTTDNVGVAAFQGLSGQATLRVVLRFGFELKVNPTSQIATFQSPSALWDKAALDYYFGVSSALRDAYPADYNDFGKLWEVITKVANAVAPVVRAVPIVGPAIEATGAAIGQVVKAARKAARKPRKKPQAKPTRK